MCDHTYCYTPAVQKIRELVARRRARRHPVRRLGPRSTSGSSSPTSTCSGTSRRTTSRSSTSSSPRAASRWRSRPRAPTRSAPGSLRRLPHAAARDGAHRPRARELAEPDEDPHHDHRRLRAHARLGRPAPAAADQHLRPRVSTSTNPTVVAGRAPDAHGVLPHRRHGRARAAARREALRAWWRSSSARSASSGPPLTDGRAGLRVLRHPRGGRHGASRATASVPCPWQEAAVDDRREDAR